MRSEVIPFENKIIGEMWTQAHRIADLDSDGPGRVVVGLNCSPALVYEPATNTDDPEQLSLYHGHIRLQFSPEEWEWLKKKLDETLRTGREMTKDLDPGEVDRLK